MKLDHKPSEEEERAVSPVIGVILMVAITVILAAVIAAFVLDLGPSEVDPQAAIDIEGDGTDAPTVTLNSIDNGDGIALVTNDTAAYDTVTLTVTGDSQTISHAGGGDNATYTVIAYRGGAPGANNELSDLEDNSSIDIVILDEFNVRD